MLVDEQSTDSVTTCEVKQNARVSLKALCWCFGFGQGCVLCFFVGSGGYYTALFSNSRFFIYLCAFFYLPPIAITVGAVLFDQSFNATHGVRVASSFRIYSSSIVSTLLLAGLWVVSTVRPIPFQSEGALVYGLGVLLGIFGAVMLSSICSMFGPIDANLVPVIIFGQTAAGLYTNIVSRAIGFMPGCEAWRVSAYWIIASATLLLTLLIFLCSHCRGLFEETFQHNDTVLESPSRLSQNLQREGRTVQVCAFPTIAPILRGGSLANLVAFASSASETVSSSGSSHRFPRICWSMAICQSIAIAMNMSLTPLANHISRGDVYVTQELVLIKLLSDLVGRTLFFLVIPTPRQSSDRSHFSSLHWQAVLVWLVELVRLPMWCCIYLRAMGSAVLENSAILLWACWLPLISLGAMSSSWCCVVAITASSSEQRANVNLLMTSSIYLGYVIGILIALVS